MLEAVEDGSDARLVSSGREGSPAVASKPIVDDRLVYKLVKVHYRLFNLLNSVALLKFMVKLIHVVFPVQSHQFLYAAYSSLE